MAASPASGAIVINEVESQPTDWVELYNTGPAPVDLGGYQIDDNNPGGRTTIAGNPMIAVGGFFTVTNPPSLGNPDEVHLFDNGGTEIDSFSYADHAAATFGRCPDGTGPLGWTTAATQDAANACPGPALAWPGSGTVGVADDINAFTSDDVSGLAYQGSGTSALGVLYVARNSNPAMLYRMVFDGTKWVHDTANSWGAGKTLLYPGGGFGAPDSEGVTLAGGDPNAVYVSVERDTNAGGVSQPGILRYDTTAAGTTLTATRFWDLTANLPGLGDNAGLEGITWVPDDVLVAKGFIDEATGVAYNPATYPNHGSGIFFVAVEQTGQIIAYALDLTNSTFTRVATINSGFPAVMELEYEPETKMLWAVCDDGCDGRTHRLDVAQSGVNDGKFQVTDVFARPAGMPNLNNEGFAITPQTECAGGLKPVYYADDSNTGGHSLRAGLISCTVLPAPDPGGGGGGGQTPPPGGGTQNPPVPGPGPVAPDIAAPTVRASLKFATRGTFAVRKTGKFGLTLTLSEKADLTITATARKNSKSKARTIVKKTTRKGVAAGKSTVTFTLSSKIRKKLKKGETVTLTIDAADAAGNKAKRVTVKGKVR